MVFYLHNSYKLTDNKPARYLNEISDIIWPHQNGEIAPKGPLLCSDSRLTLPAGFQLNDFAFKIVISFI
ncbi:hypothetical protein D1614_07485 [Maribellus luteus]|uniref:Uncharacterized protein n=1 Tax=Maribellus luteus TaxID=2305463 RepID=A0A399SZB4_9BACT|nr:hypothetical protein D1614_07485 [Maribellus luteus]